MNQTQPLDDFLSKLPKTVRKLRVKKGPTSRNLRTVGPVEFPGDVETDERDLDVVVEEIEGALEAAGFDPDDETFGLDALDEKGKKVRSWQDSDADMGRDRAARGKNRTDLEALLDAFIEKDRVMNRMLANVTGAFREERQYANAAREEILEERSARSEMEAMNALLADQVERGVEGAEESAKTRGIEALENLVGTIKDRRAGKVSPEDAKDILKKNPTILDDLFDDPEMQGKFAAALARRAEKQ